MNRTRENKEMGERVIYDLSNKARTIAITSDPLTIYGYNESGIEFYDLEGVFEAKHLTLAELDDYLCEMGE